MKKEKSIIWAHQGSVEHLRALGVVLDLALDSPDEVFVFANLE